MLVNCHGNITEINVISIYQISEKQFSPVLIGSRNLEYPWLFTYFATGAMMPSRFETFLDDEICVINQTVVQAITT